MIARKLHLAGTVSDLNTLVASRYIHCTVEAFRLEALRLFNEGNDDGFTWQDSKFWMKILTKHDSQYQNLLGVNEWPPALAKKKQSEQINLQKEVK